MKLTKEQIEYNKREVIELLRSTKRDGIDGLLKVMEEGGYYTAKCHSHHHYVGGLMLHSLSACRIALSKDSGLSRDSISFALFYMTSATSKDILSLVDMVNVP